MDALVDPDEAPELKRQRPSAGVLNEMAAEDLGGVAPGAVPARPATAADEAALRRAAGQKNMDSVIKLYVMTAEPNYAQPWQAREASRSGGIARVRPQRASTGSGFVLEGRRLLTNAHVVLSCTTVHVRREGRPKKWPARVLCCAPAVDLALLTVDDDSFWDSLCPLRLAEVPHLQDSVVVVGYPVGGDSICVTKGVVSRVDLRPYAAGSNSLLTVQIDAAINPGNSGGPAFSDIQRGLVAGVAFSKLRSGDNIGFIIPSPVVRHFLDEVAQFGVFRGVAGRGFQWQKAENAALRTRHRIPAGASGVLVARLDPLAPSSAPGALRPRDILMSVEGVPIADDGTVAFRGAERLDFTHLWRQRHVGEQMRATVWRDGASLDVSFAVQRPRPLVPILHTVDATPSYYIVGGLVFLPLSVPFLEHGYGASWRKATPVKLQALLAEYRTAPDEEVVLLFQILSAELNYGYKGTSLWVTHFNGQKVRNLAQMAALVEAATGEFLEWDTDDGSCIVLDRAEALAQGGTILAQHAIANDRSADLRLLQPGARAEGTPPPSAPPQPPPPGENSDNSQPSSRKGGAAAAPLGIAEAVPPYGGDTLLPDAQVDTGAAAADAPLLRSQRPGDPFGDFGMKPAAASFSAAALRDQVAALPDFGLRSKGVGRSSALDPAVFHHIPDTAPGPW